MKCQITRGEDLRQKLDNTICRYKGEPYLVRIDGKNAVLFDIVDTSKSVLTVKTDDDDFDIASPSLGYMNYRDKVVYISRPPLRRTRQGIEPRNLSFKNISGDKSQGIGYRDSGNEYVFSEGFRNLILGKYPDVGEVIKELRAEWKKNQKVKLQRAVSRNIAFSVREVGIIDVYYKTESVGYILPNSDVVNVPDIDKSWIISRYLAHELSWTID